MVKDHSNSERGNQLLPHGLLFPIRSGQSVCAHSEQVIVMHACHRCRPMSVPLSETGFLISSKHFHRWAVVFVTPFVEH